MVCLLIVNWGRHWTNNILAVPGSTRCWFCQLLSSINHRSKIWLSTAWCWPVTARKCRSKIRTTLIQCWWVYFLFFYLNKWFNLLFSTSIGCQ
jgi:hypothetical protein